MLYMIAYGLADYFPTPATAFLLCGRTHRGRKKRYEKYGYNKPIRNNRQIIKAVNESKSVSLIMSLFENEYVNYGIPIMNL